MRSGQQNKGLALNGKIMVFSHIGAPTHYSLKLGENHIGRLYPDGDVPDIPVQDNFTSRFHAVITISKLSNGTFQYLLTDNNKNGSGKASTNGTYVNESLKRISEEEVYVLKAFDKIRVGKTELIFKIIEE